MESHSAGLVARWRLGDQQAAAELFRRYADQLISVARKQLSHKLTARFDPEDAVLSAYRSFFCGSRAGRYEVERGGDLWRLLLTITLHKLTNLAKFNRRRKRDVERDQRLADEDGWLREHAARLAQVPTPLEAVTLVDELENALRRMKPRYRCVLEFRLQGYTMEEIEEKTQFSVCTVRRILSQVKQHFIEAGYTSLDAE